MKTEDIDLFTLWVYETHHPRYWQRREYADMTANISEDTLRELFLEDLHGAAGAADTETDG